MNLSIEEEVFEEKVIEVCLSVDELRNRLDELIGYRMRVAKAGEMIEEVEAARDANVALDKLTGTLKPLPFTHMVGAKK